MNKISEFSLHYGIAQFIGLGNAYVPSSENSKVGFLRLSAFQRIDKVWVQSNEKFVLVLHDEKFSYVLLIRNVDKKTINIRQLSTYDSVTTLKRMIVEMLREGEEPHVSDVEVFEKEILPWMNFFNLFFKPWRALIKWFCLPSIDAAKIFKAIFYKGSV